MIIKYKIATITKLYLNSEHNNKIYAILVDDMGKIISNAPIETVLNIIEVKRMILINEDEILDLLNIFYGIDYSKYGKLNAGNI
jgi:hypothetical protein